MEENRFCLTFDADNICHEAGRTVIVVESWIRAGVYVGLCSVTVEAFEERKTGCGTLHGKDLLYADKAQLSANNCGVVQIKVGVTYCCGGADSVGFSE